MSAVSQYSWWICHVIVRRCYIHEYFPEKHNLNILRNIFSIHHGSIVSGEISNWYLLNVDSLIIHIIETQLLQTKTVRTPFFP
jgi:hypothetical protein